MSRNRAYIFDRGGQKVVGEVQEPIRVEWGRVRDDTSESKVLARASRCTRLMDGSNVGRYEMVVERDGEREWEGPITYFKTEGGVTEIQAKDITWYTNRTALTRAWDNTKNAVYVIDRIRSIIEWECARKEELGYRILEGLVVKPSVDGARTKRMTLPYEKYVFEEMDDLAWRNGIDYTVVRRNLMLNDTDYDFGLMRTLTQADFDGDLALTTYGVELATRSIVTDGMGRAGVYEGDTGIGEHPYYGEVVLLHTEYNESAGEFEEGSDTPISVLRSQAQRNYSGRSRPMTALKAPENTQLAPATANELMPSLIPGMRANIVLDNPALPRLSEMMRLDTMKVSEDKDGESVSVTFSSTSNAEPIIEE